MSDHVYVIDLAGLNRCPRCEMQPSQMCDPRVADLGPVAYFWHDERVLGLNTRSLPNGDAHLWVVVAVLDHSDGVKVVWMCREATKLFRHTGTRDVPTVDVGEPLVLSSAESALLRGYILGLGT